MKKNLLSNYLERQKSWYELKFFLRWKTRAMACEKQTREMKEILERCMHELKERRGEIPIPLRVNRSVGLQVSFNSAARVSPFTLFEFHSFSFSDF